MCVFYTFFHNFPANWKDKADSLSASTSLMCNKYFNRYNRVMIYFFFRKLAFLQLFSKTDILLSQYKKFKTSREFF